MTQPRLEMEGVGKRYRRGATSSLRARFFGRTQAAQWVDVLHDVDLTVHPGDVVGVIGRNGGGKSTLLRVAAGLTEASAGQVRRHATVSGLLALNASASAELSAADNAVTAAVLAGLSPQQARARLGQIAEFAELDDATMREPFRTFSDGMRLRLAFAAAAVTEPELLLVDEVLAVGDFAFQEKCLAHIENLTRQGCSVLVASHVLDHLRRLATRVVWIRSGTIYHVGDPGKVLDTYERSMDEYPGAPQSLSGGGFRKGDGGVRLTQVTCLDRNGVEVSSVARGDAVSVRLEYERHNAEGHANFGVALRRVGSDLAIIDLTTEGSGAGWTTLADRGAVTLTLDRLDLEPDAYWVDTGSYSTDWVVPFDYHWDALQLQVLGRPASGPVQPPHRWSSS